jgi:hypothetical protein
VFGLSKTKLALSNNDHIFIHNMSHLTNSLATTSQLYNRASFSSLPQDLQESIFIATQCLTQAAGLLLELPQAVTAQANVILARYWLIEPPMASEFSVSILLGTSLNRPGASFSG